MTSICESHIEQAALDWFEEIGWSVLRGPDIAPEEPTSERASYSDVILRGRLETAIDYLNPTLLTGAKEDVLRKVLHSDSPSLILREMVPEAVVNALVHRDYSIEGAKCQLIVDEHTIVIMSPGPPPAPITVEQLQSFNAPMLSRNPGLHYVFARMEMAEERGLGIKSLKAQAEQAGLPLPKYAFNDPYLVLTLYRSPIGAVQAVGEETLRALSEAEKSGWKWLSTRDIITSVEYAEAMGIPLRTARYHLRRLSVLGLLRVVGARPATRYEIIRP